MKKFNIKAIYHQIGIDGQLFIVRKLIFIITYSFICGNNILTSMS